MGWCLGNTENNFDKDVTMIQQMNLIKKGLKVLSFFVFLFSLFVHVISAQTWLPPVNISNTPDSSDRPTLAVDSAGTVHVVWCDYPVGYYYAYKTSYGIWSTPTLLIETPLGCQNSALVISSDNTLHLAWEDTTLGIFQIFYASKPYGGNWTSPVRVSGGINDQSYEPGLVVDTGGTVHLTWWAAGPFVSYYTMKPPGGNWSSPSILQSGVTGRGSDLAIDAEGTLHFVWQIQDHNVTDTNIYHLSKPSAGGNWSSAELVSDCGGTGTSSSYCAGGFIAASGNTLHAIWHKFTPPNFVPDIYYAYKIGSAPWSQPVSISNTPGDSFIHNINGLALDANGRPHVVWFDNSSGNNEILYATFDGTSWMSPVNLSNSPSSSHMPGIAIGGDYIHIAWDEGDVKPDILYTTTAPQNQVPTANAGGSYSVGEGGSTTLNGSGSDPDNDPLTFSWDMDNNGTFETLGQNVIFSAIGRDGPSSQIIVLQVCDDKSACTTASTTIDITNVEPTVGTITAPTDPLSVNSVVNVSATFTDPGVLDTHTAVWNWGDGTFSSAIVTETNGSGSVTGSHTYTVAGVYSLQIAVTDKDGASGQNLFNYVVIFDSTAGFATGAGMIDSPAGAYPQDPNLIGRANFGFSVKYLPGDTVPNGGSQFKFRIADINFTSTSYQWLVISGSKAIFKGIGTNNGIGDYTFLVSTIDGSPDKYRIKITDNSTNTVFYDNEMGSSETVDPTTPLVAGSVIIH